MSRKRKDQPGGYDKAFPTAMRKLMEQKGTTQNELAEHLKKTRQAVSYYCDGSSSPDWETIVKIADYFNVSADYLLGRTEDPNRLPSIVDDLELSVRSVKAIKEMDNLYTPNDSLQYKYRAGRGIDILNCLLESPDFPNLMESLMMCFDCYLVNAKGREFEYEDYEAEEGIREAGHIVLHGAEAAKFYANEAGNCLKEVACKEISILVDSFIMGIENK